MQNEKLTRLVKKSGDGKDVFIDVPTDQVKAKKDSGWKAVSKDSTTAKEAK